MHTATATAGGPLLRDLLTAAATIIAFRYCIRALGVRATSIYISMRCMHTERQTDAQTDAQTDIHKYT